MIERGYCSRCERTDRLTNGYYCVPCLIALEADPRPAQRRRRTSSELLKASIANATVTEEQFQGWRAWCKAHGWTPPEER
jgi:molybdenum cofactor biosynthesis enzyme MoaA